MAANRLCIYEANLALKAKEALDKNHRFKSGLIMIVVKVLRLFDGTDKHKVEHTVTPYSQEGFKL